MAIDLATLFARLGKGFYVQEQVNVARGTTVPPLVKAYQDQFDSASLELKRAMAPAEEANRSFQSGSNALLNGFRSSLQEALIQTVVADATLDTQDLRHALEELVRQMVAGGSSIDASAVAATASAVTGNGDGVLVASAKRTDGLAQQNALAETIKIECTSDGTPATAGFTARGDVVQTDRLAYDWPKGSGISRGITATDAASSLLSNGDFDDDEDDLGNAPDEWIVSVGTAGTTIKTTVYEVQQIVVSGTPTAGSYSVNWTDEDGKTHSTLPLAFDASGSTLQAALRTLPGLEDVEVETTGTSPDFTHVITFENVAGDLSQVTITNNTTGGLFTPSTTTAGSANAYKGKAVEFDSDGAQLTTINQPVTLLPLRQYAFNFYMLADVVPAAGVVTVDLVDGIGGTVLQDEQGVDNSFTIDCTALTTSFAAKNGVFRTPQVLPSAVYLRIRISTAVSAGTSIFFDHAALVEMTELYPGGPSAAIFSGRQSFVVGTPMVAADYFTLTVTNDRGGEFQEWFDRNFDMRGKGLLLPSNSAGGETISDALIG